MQHFATDTFLQPTLIEHALHWRQATKQFDPAKIIADNKFDLLLESLRLAPSSLNMQPWKFIVVKNKTVRRKIFRLSLNQKQILDASHLVLLCNRRTVNAAYFNRIVAQEKNIRKGVSDLEAARPFALALIESKTPEELREWMAQQVYIALGFLLFSSSLMHIDACPIEAFDHSKLDTLLDLHKKGIESRVLVVLGHRTDEAAHEPSLKIRREREDVLITV